MDGGGNILSPVAWDEARVIAENFPDDQVILMNSIGSGGSGDAPSSVRKEMRKTESFEPLAEYLAPMYDDILSDYDTIHFRGHSAGAHLAAALTGNLADNKVDSLILHDPVGVEKMKMFELLNRFASVEGNHLAKYVNSGFDTHVGKLQEELNSPVNFLKNAMGSGILQQYLADPWALKGEDFKSVLPKAYENVERDGLLRIVVPELSELSRPAAIRDVATSVLNARDVHAKLELAVTQDHTHSVNTIPQVLATVYDEKAGQ